MKLTFGNLLKTGLVIILLASLVIIIRQRFGVRPMADPEQMNPTEPLSPSGNSSPAATETPPLSPTLTATPTLTVTSTRPAFTLSSTITPTTKVDATDLALGIYLIQLQGSPNREQRAQFLVALEKALKRPVEVIYEYDVVYGGFAVRLTPQEARQVAEMAGVLRVQPDAERQLQPDRQLDSEFDLDRNQAD